MKAEPAAQACNVWADVRRWYIPITEVRLIDLAITTTNSDQFADLNIYTPFLSNKMFFLRKHKLEKATIASSL
jgi:hypothetical protein